VGVLGAKQLYIALKGDQNGAGVKFQSNALCGKFHFCDFISSAPPPHYLVGIRDKQAQVVKTNFQPEVLLMT
jgi:hypothetical protein